MPQFILRNLPDSWFRAATIAKLQGWPIQALVVQLMRDFADGKIRPSVEPPMPPPAERDGLVSMPSGCGHCQRQILIELSAGAGLTAMKGYRIECPWCGKPMERMLPEPPVAVRRPPRQGRPPVRPLPRTAESLSSSES